MVISEASKYTKTNFFCGLCPGPLLGEHAALPRPLASGGWDSVRPPQEPHSHSRSFVHWASVVA